MIYFSMRKIVLREISFCEPNAEGSVHIPYSDQNPGMNQTSGNVVDCLQV